MEIHSHQTLQSPVVQEQAADIPAVVQADNSAGNPADSSAVVAADKYLAADNPAVEPVPDSAVNS